MECETAVRCRERYTRLQLKTPADACHVIEQRSLGVSSVEYLATAYLNKHFIGEALVQPTAALFMVDWLRNT